MDSADEEVDAKALDSELRSLGLMQAIPSSSAPGRTVLPVPLASAVSLATRSSCLAIRVGTLIGSYGFDAARVTTLSSLELGRGILEGILARAGKDMLSRSQSDLARADAETIIERSLDNLHHAMSQLVFWTTTGFHVTSTTFSMFSEITQLLLTSLDQFFGSTDSSRAIASIITLIRREFQNPVTGADGQQVGVTDLVMGLCALAYLQRRCWRLEAEESRRLGHEEIVWDVVVLNDGERVDVHENSLYGVHKGHYQTPAPDILVSKPGPAPSPSILATLQHHGSHDSSDEDEDDSPETRLRRQIMETLPADARVSIRTSTVTQKTITVDFQASEVPAIPPPPGVVVVEREVLPPSTQDLSIARRGGQHTSTSPTHRVVYKVERRKTTNTSCQGHETPREYAESVVESVDDSDSDESSIGSPVISPSMPAQPLFPTDAPPLIPKRMSSSTVLKQEPTNTPSIPRKPSAPDFRQSASPRTQPSTPTPPKTTPPANRENISNQKRQRTPLAPLPVKQKQENTRPSPPMSSKTAPARSRTEPAPEKPAPKKSSIRQALKRAPGSNLSNLWNRDSGGSGSSLSLGKEKKTVRTPQVPEKPPRLPVQPSRQVLSRATGPTIASNQRERNILEPSHIPRSSSRASYISVHESRRDSIVSHADSFSIHSVETNRPATPMFPRHRPSSGMLRQFAGKDNENDFQTSPRSIMSRRTRPRGHAPSMSLYSIATSGSQASLVLSQMHPKSAYTDSEAIDNLRRVGTLNDIFPSFHLLRNVTRFMRFSSASYGSNFLKVLGISTDMPMLKSLDDTHQEIRSFAHHTGTHTDSILMASFVDHQGGSDTTGSTGTGVPLVHYISLDHESKAVVLACRGTLGFEDILADLACDYDDLHWRGKPYQVHKGVHASARRLLYGGDGRVLYTLKEALDEFTDYGLVLCGHSLGGAVTALLGTMLSEPSPTGTGFVTSAEPHRRLLTASNHVEANINGSANICLPAGRPIHVYAYGPPGTMSPSLRKATRGLITSTIHGNDLVPFLSLGVLHDFQAVALAFKNDGHDSKLEVKQHVWQAFQTGLADRWYTGGIGGKAPSAEDDGESPWSIAALTTLRTGMMNPKLVPPGEVFVVESSKVLRRDAFLLAGEEDFGRPAKRVVFKYVRDVESRFREVRFGTSMLMDHSPAGYEEALGKLRLGVADAR